MTLSYKATLLVTFFLTVVFDLTVAVEVGLVVACVFFLMRMNNITVVEPATLPFNVPDTVEAWHIKGALFFGSVSKLEPVTDPTRITRAGSSRVVILDMEELINIDNSAMDQIETFVRALHRHNHELIIAGASGHPQRQLQRTGIAQSLGAPVEAASAHGHRPSARPQPRPEHGVRPGPRQHGPGRIGREGPRPRCVPRPSLTPSQPLITEGASGAPSRQEQNARRPERLSGVSLRGGLPIQRSPVPAPIIRGCT